MRPSIIGGTWVNASVDGFHSSSTSCWFVVCWLATFAPPTMNAWPSGSTVVECM